MILSTSGVPRDDSLTLYFDPAIAGSQWNGSECFDLSGNGHHGELADGSPTTATNFGGTLVMDGLTDQVKFLHNLATDTNTNFSMSCWVRYTSLTNQNGQSVQQFCTMGPTTSGSGLAMGERNNTHQCWGTGGSIKVNSATNIVAGQWYNVTYTYDGTTHRIYIDGALDGTGTGAADNSATTHLVFSGWNTPTSSMGGYKENFYGQQGPVLVYNRTLTDQEVEQIFNTFRGRYGI